MNKIIILLTLTCIFFTGCKDSFLDQEPPLYVNGSDIYTDAERIESTLLGIYGSLKSGTFMGGKTYLVFDNRGDDIININSNLVTLYDTYYMNVGATYAENETAWYDAYLAINRANVFMDSMEEYNSVEVLGESTYNQYIAEAKFVRALCYYYLCQLYSQPYVLNPNAKAVPLRLEGIQESGHNDCPRSAINDIYNAILTDLDAAAISALHSNVNSYDAVTRASQAAARMLKMRVYMAMENWDAAISEGEAIQGYSLPTDVTSMFNAPYYTQESIFSLPMSSNSKPNTQQSCAEYYYNGSICVIDYENGVLGKSAYSLESDARVEAFVNGDIIAKFTDAQDKLQWVPIFRYAETLLNLAECYANRSRAEDARQALSSVRRRSVAEGDDILSLSTLSGDNLLTAIEDEKRLELICEGVRGIDIIRKGETFVKGQGVTKVTVTPTSTGYTWPIPASEAAVNNSIND